MTIDNGILYSVLKKRSHGFTVTLELRRGYLQDHDDGHRQC